MKQSKMRNLFLLTSLVPHAAAQISAFFDSGPACIQDCEALSAVNRNCMLKGQVNIDCLCTDDLMVPLYAGGNCGCTGSQGVAFRSWLDGPAICSAQQSAFDATGVRTTSTPTPTSASSSAEKTTMETSSKSSSSKSSSSDTDKSTITSMSLVTSQMTGFVQSEPTKPALATGEDDGSGGSWEKKKKWALPVIIVVALGVVLGILLLACCIWKRKQNRNLGGYAGVKGGGGGAGNGIHRNQPWWLLGGLLGQKKSKVRESTMSEAGHGLVNGGTEYQGNSFEPPSTRVLQRDQYGNYTPRTQGPPYIVAGSYPHGRPLSPVEELRSAAPTPSIASTAGSPPPQEGYGHASTFRDIPEGAALGGGIGGAPGQAGLDYQGNRIPPAAPSAGLGVIGGGGVRNATPPSRQVSNSSSDFSYTDSDISNARGSPLPILSQQRRKPVRRQFNPDDAPSNSSSIRSAYNPVSPVSPLSTSAPSDAGNGFNQISPPVPPTLSPLRHPKIRNSPQYYEDYN